MKRLTLKFLYLIILTTLFVILFWKVSLTGAIFWTLFFTFLLFKLNIRLIAIFTLTLLISCPILIIFKKESIAGQMAIYVYYFLVMAVVLQIVEYIKDSRIRGFKD